MTARRRVAVVTGGGGGIGGAVAEELGRAGWFVVTLDPMVTVDGSAQIDQPTATTADRIVAAGGSARASFASVTDAEAVNALFTELAGEFGGLDAVVNVAGISRPTGFAAGTEADWLAVARVHVDGYLNVLRAALPIMAENGRGHMLGVTSGSGWRAADAGAYSAAKRAVASLTWQLGPLVPSGVTVNAMSPIAATRMVRGALERARQPGRSGGPGISLQGMPEPEELAPLAAYLVSEDFGWSTGRVVFAGGSEMALVDAPRLLEVVRSRPVASLDHVLAAVIPRALGRSEAAQRTDGGTNPRFGPIFDEPGDADHPPPPAATCLVASDPGPLAEAVTAAIEARSVKCRRTQMAHDFEGAAGALRAARQAGEEIDAVVLVGGKRTGADGGATTWESVLADHDGIVDDLHTDASWARAVADYAVDANRPVSLVTACDASSGGGRTRAQAAAQLSRMAAASTADRVSAFTISVEGAQAQCAEQVATLIAHLLTNPEARALAGAELAAGPGWVGLRSHPRPVGSIVYGGPALPYWVDGALREMAGVAMAAGGRQG